MRRSHLGARPETTEQILALLRDINQRFGLTVVLITHDMSVIRQACDRVLVLDHGRVVEQSAVRQAFLAPRADATLALRCRCALRQALPPAANEPDPGAARHG